MLCRLCPVCWLFAILGCLIGCILSCNAVYGPAMLIVLISCLVYWQAIDNLDADVLTIENSRSGNEMIVALAKYGYKKDVGPGVYDVHSPVVPR